MRKKTRLLTGSHCCGVDVRRVAGLPTCSACGTRLQSGYAPRPERPGMSGRHSFLVEEASTEFSTELLRFPDRTETYGR